MCRWSYVPLDAVSSDAAQPGRLLSSYSSRFIYNFEYADTWCCLYCSCRLDPSVPPGVLLTDVAQQHNFRVIPKEHYTFRQARPSTRLFRPHGHLMVTHMQLSIHGLPILRVSCLLFKAPVLMTAWTLGAVVHCWCFFLFFPLHVMP